MRTTLLPKSLLVAALSGVVVLAGLGAQNATAAPTSVPGAVAASDQDAEVRFLELADLIGQSCAPDLSLTVDAVASSAEAGTTTAVEPAPDSVQPVPVDAVPLDATEECVAQRHQTRISRAFSGTNTGTYEELRNKLIGLQYPAARIHRMPDFNGEPVVRIDLRVGADHPALEVTDIGNSVMIEAFGAPDGVSVTEVRLERLLDAPSF
ncbi:hypothetical protein OHA37_17635 [Streptomyces sp. NBC_00335]|uniref:hypothetical protein n=1 Tax=unclassified Streptomyces TaxID=2593676 RepID=UPI002257006C|nr:MULTISPECIES: hypothetical protein [unclassified Streptomyces]MCX5405702.1 hypothetical protein [Streptomyces sp. NBC_00086]